MKFSPLILSLIFSSMVSAQNLDEFRTLLKSGENSENSAKLLIEKSTSAYKITNKPIYEGFMGLGKMFMAKHAFSPFKKMSYFNDGKRALENAVKKDPDNLEIRLMRLVTQENIPKILNYYQQIAEDRSFLKREYLKTDDQDLKTNIKEYLKI